MQKTIFFQFVFLLSICCNIKTADRQEKLSLQRQRIEMVLGIQKQGENPDKNQENPLPLDFYDTRVDNSICSKQDIYLSDSQRKCFSGHP